MMRAGIGVSRSPCCLRCSADPCVPGNCYKQQKSSRKSSAAAGRTKTSLNPPQQTTTVKKSHLKKKSVGTASIIAAPPTIRTHRKNFLHYISAKKNTLTQREHIAILLHTFRPTQWPSRALAIEFMIGFPAEQSFAASTKLPIGFLRAANSRIFLVNATACRGVKKCRTKKNSRG